MEIKFSDIFSKIKKNIFILFIIKTGVLYGLSYFVYEFFIKPSTRIDQLLIRKIINFCEVILNLLGYKTFASKETDDIQVFGIDGSNGVWIGGPCNGITLMFLFAIFVLAYPGNQKNKFWFIPLGILFVHLINVFRIIALAIIAYYYPQYLDFNHTYTFTFLVYTLVFALWILWVNRFSTRSVY